MIELTAEAVETLVRYCLYREEELTGADPAPDRIEVEGIIRTFGFHPGRIAEKSTEIGALLQQLPEAFHAQSATNPRGGGGWSFLQACVDRDGRQWGEHQQMEALFVLGIAAGRAKWTLPKSLWPSLPAGMPYATIYDPSPPPAQLYDDDAA